jgi:hypothetical protein
MMMYITFNPKICHDIIISCKLKNYLLNFDVPYIAFWGSKHYNKREFFCLQIEIQDFKDFQ